MTDHIGKEVMFQSKIHKIVDVRPVEDIHVAYLSDDSRINIELLRFNVNGEWRFLDD